MFLRPLGRVVSCPTGTSLWASLIQRFEFLPPMQRVLQEHQSSPFSTLKLVPAKWQWKRSMFQNFPLRAPLASPDPETASKKLCVTTLEARTLTAGVLLLGLGKKLEKSPDELLQKLSSRAENTTTYYLWQWVTGHLNCKLRSTTATMPPLLRMRSSRGMACKVTTRSKSSIL